MRGAGGLLTAGGLLLALAVLTPWPLARGFLFGAGGVLLYRAAVPREGLRALGAVLWGFLPVFLFAAYHAADFALTALTWGRPWEAFGWGLFALAFVWGGLRAARDAGRLWREGGRQTP